MNKTKLWTVLILLMITLSGCTTPDRPTTSRRFSNYSKSYEYIEFSWSGEVNVDINKGYYVPEVQTVCFVVTVTDTADAATYEANFYYGDPDDRSTDTIEVDLAFEKSPICYEALDAYDYEMEVYRYDPDSETEIKILWIQFDATDLDETQVMDFNFDIEYFSDPVGDVDSGMEIMTEIEIDEYPSTGSIIYKVFADASGAYVGTYSVDLRDFSSELDTLTTIAPGLDEDVYYEITAYYDPLGDQEILFELDSIVIRMAD